MEGLKINLDALKNNNVKGDESEIKQEEITNKDVDIGGLKSLNYISIGDEEETENIIEINNKGEVSIMEEKNDFGILKKKIDNNTITDIDIPEKKLKDKEDIKKDENLTPKISIGNIKELKKENQDNSQKEEVQEIVKEENKELFSEYKSDFIKEEGIILEKIKKIKKLPKTRFGMLILLISFISIIIAGLFYFDPGHYNINRYKTGFLGLLGQKVQITEEKRKEEIINKDNNSSKKIIGNKQNYIGNEYEIKIIDGAENFIYKDTNYTNKDELIKAIKRDKINDFLNK